ncbi:sterol desaturase family protein [Paracoccus sp. p3-h83]|uniref:sterol desaturase family protein n=2 Tax=unclassified Paracoccus (in: a-proteobacteria) TaxID=2688777 RepID=UPI0035B8E634
MSRVRLMLGHRSILMMIAVVVLGIALVLGAGGGWLWALAVLGIPLQMLNEYGLHRFIFHLPPPRAQWAFDLLYRAHYGHHDFPTNTRLIFAPEFVVIPVLAINFALVWAVLALVGFDRPFGGAAALVMVGGAATFLAYEWFHTTAHVPCTKTAVERHVATLHNQHHFRDFTKWFHVTAGGEVIDRVMGTAIDREALKSAQRVEFIRTLGMRPDDPRLIAARQRFAAFYGLSADEIARAARG